MPTTSYGSNTSNRRKMQAGGSPFGVGATNRHPKGAKPATKAKSGIVKGGKPKAKTSNSAKPKKR